MRLSHTAASKAEAQKWIREQLTRADQGLLPADGGKVTVEAYFARWLGKRRLSVKPKTLHGYRFVVRAYILPTLGDTQKLGELRSDHLQALYAARRDSGLSARTVQICHRVLRAALSDALRARLVARNVADATTPPRPKRPKMRYWSPEQARTSWPAWPGIAWRPCTAWRCPAACGAASYWG